MLYSGNLSFIKILNRALIKKTKINRGMHEISIYIWQTLIVLDEDFGNANLAGSLFFFFFFLLAS